MDVSAVYPMIVSQVYAMIVWLCHVPSLSEDSIMNPFELHPLLGNNTYSGLLVELNTDRFIHEYEKYIHNLRA